MLDDGLHGTVRYLTHVLRSGAHSEAAQPTHPRRPQNEQTGTHANWAIRILQQAHVEAASSRHIWKQLPTQARNPKRRDPRPERIRQGRRERSRRPSPRGSRHSKNRNLYEIIPEDPPTARATRRSGSTTTWPAASPTLPPNPSRRTLRDNAQAFIWKMMQKRNSTKSR